MKNKSILIISIILIFAFAGGILTVSKRMEKSWNDVTIVTNDLTANSENITTGETTFDYPYTQINPKLLADVYGASQEEIDTLPIVEDDAGYMGSISFQQAANIVGELLKDIYGYTGTQKNPVRIGLYNMPNWDYWLDNGVNNKAPEESRHLEMTFSNFWLVENEDAGYGGNLDPYTGQVICLQWTFPYDTSVNFARYKLTEDEARKMYNNEIKNLMILMGNESPVTEIVYRNRDFDDDVEAVTHRHIFDVTCEDGTHHEFKFFKLDGSLVRYYNSTLYEQRAVSDQPDFLVKDKLGNTQDKS